MSCTYCGEEKVVAKGLCQACYQRQYKYGTLEYQRINQPKKICSVDGCDGVVVAKGYCQKHYKMNQRKGTPVSTFGYGKRRSHHLYDIWRQQVKSKEGRVSRWDDFFVFVGDVSEKPEGNFMARRQDESMAWGPDNFYWYKTLGIPSVDKGKYHDAYAKIHKERMKAHNLKKDFNISFDDFVAMYESQNGCCKICGEHRPLLSTEKGKRNSLCVDHDHATGDIRGLLCCRCNTRLGRIENNWTARGIDLEKVAEYLGVTNKP